jgi:hypothetical protein
VPKLRRWLDSPDSTRRSASARTLRALGQRVSEVELRRRDLKDNSCPVRRDAALYFSEHPAPSAKADLEEAFRRSTSRVEKPTTGIKSIFVKTHKVTVENCDHDALLQALKALDPHG